MANEEGDDPGVQGGSPPTWLDEVKARAAQEAAAQAGKAASEAGRAMVDGVVGGVAGQVDGWLGVMESELARRQQEAAPKPVDPADAPQAPTRPTADERQAAAEAELERLKADARRTPTSDPAVDDPGPPAAPVADPPPAPAVEPWVRPDPMAAARAALDKARQVRRELGIPEPAEPILARSPDPKDPFAAAQDALERAAAARAAVGRSAAQIDREERAKRELEQLKSGRAPTDPAAPDPTTQARPAEAPKRRL